VEPEPNGWQPVSYDMYGYSGVHHLRLVAVHLDLRGGPPPRGRPEHPERDPLYNRYYAREFLPWRRRRRRSFEHLMIHADSDGFYVPIDFEHPIVAGETMVGSSQRLMRECQQLAALLGLPPELDPDSDELWEAAEEDADEPHWRRYGIAAFTCQQLLWASQASVKHGALLVFH
jgi:hypothetical protein